MKILRASHLGMCFGVRDAIGIALAQTEPSTILGELVHNESILDDLRSRGVRSEQQLDAVVTPTVMITAHGASERAINSIRERGLKVLEATCPLVRYAHRAILKLAQEGFHPVIIGDRQHVEVRGLTGDLDTFDVVLTEEDIARLSEHARFGIAAQTTQPIDKVRKLIALMRERFPSSEVRFIDTVCQPTKQRQTAAIEMALNSGVVVVIGGVNSNNTRELVATCAKFCPSVHHIQTAADLRLEWFTNAETVGLTAGTSTPDEIIDRVEARLKGFAARPDATPAETLRDKLAREPFPVMDTNDKDAFIAAAKTRQWDQEKSVRILA
jgi:4-hydroxy-3-methylbut-2-enyl diphosphate reductase